MTNLTTTGAAITASLAVTLMPWTVARIDEPSDLFKNQIVTARGNSYTVIDSHGASTVGTTSGAPAMLEESQTPNLSAIIAELKSESGLTADQLGRLLGVTRRSIHNWAAGAPVAPKHEARIRELSQLVADIEAISPEERREAMLNSANGPSLYRQFLLGTPRAERILYPVPVNERFEK